MHLKLQQWSLKCPRILEDDKCNVLEEDLYSIYECLDPILDQHVLGPEYKVGKQARFMNDTKNLQETVIL